MDSQIKHAPQLLSSSLSSASSLVVLQLFSRIFTFLLNQALVRLASPQTFGTASIQFELLLSTILFLCREGVRTALLRAHTINVADGKQSSSTTLVNNISYLPVLLGVPTAIIAGMLYATGSASSTSSQPYFYWSVTLYASAAILELTAEPLYIRAQNELRFQVRVRAEGTAIIAKTVITFIFLAFAPPTWALLAFAFGQTGYSLAILSSYMRVYKPSKLFQLKMVDDGKSATYFDPHLLYLSAAMTWQSVIKHFLTEGDKFLISYFSPLEDQGGYALASNYGSLVARIILQPIEETARVFFSKTLSSAGGKTTKDSLNTASNVLFSLLLSFAHILLLFLTFGPPYLPLVISILLPHKYRETSAPLILHTYIYYIPTMAFNGVLEAFFASTSTPADLRVQSRWMVFFSLAFIASAIILSRGLELGDPGLVWANIFNLGARAFYAGLFVNRFFRDNNESAAVRWSHVVPPASVLSMFVMAAAITRASASKYSGYSAAGQITHVSIGIACLAGCLGACYILERPAFQQIVRIMKRK